MPKKAGAGDCRQLGSDQLARAMAELRSLLLPGHKGDGLPAYYLGAGAGATNLWVFGRDFPAAVAGLALFKPADSPIVLTDGYLNAFPATTHIGVVVTKKDELQALPKTVRGYLATPIAISEGFFMQSLSLIDYACALEFTKPLLKYIWDNHLIDGDTNTLLGDGKDDSKMLRAVVANPRMTRLIDRHEKQILHLLTETRGLDGGVLSVPAMRQVLEWTTLNN